MTMQTIDGKLSITWESGQFSLADTEPLNDGKWHWAELKWMQGELWLNTDYGLYEKTVPVDSKLTGLMPTRVVLGRLETVNTTGLIGCIKVSHFHPHLNSPRPLQKEKEQTREGIKKHKKYKRLQTF